MNKSFGAVQAELEQGVAGLLDPLLSGLEAGGEDAEGIQPQIGVRSRAGLQQDFVFAEKASERRDACDRKRSSRHRPESPWDVLSQPAHVPHVLISANRVNHRPGSKEE